MGSSPHFEIAQWTDFARGQVGEAERKAMETHLVSGCLACRGMADVFEKLLAIAQADTACEPPKDAVRTVKALLRPARGEKARSVTRVLARLIHDSFAGPLPAGVRAADRPGHALYEAGRLSLLVSVMHEAAGERGRARFCVVGQIADRKQPKKRLAGVPLQLVSGKQVVARSLTNHLGEFQLDCDAGDRLKLEVSTESGRKAVVLPLPRKGLER